MYFIIYDFEKDQQILGQKHLGGHVVANMNGTGNTILHAIARHHRNLCQYVILVFNHASHTDIHQ